MGEPEALPPPPTHTAGHPSQPPGADLFSSTLRMGPEEQKCPRQSSGAPCGGPQRTVGTPELLILNTQASSSAQQKKKKKPKPKTGPVPSGPQTAKLLFTPKSEATEVRLKLTLLITAKGTRMRLPPSPPAKGYIKNNKNKKALPPAPAPLWKDGSRL